MESEALMESEAHDVAAALASDLEPADVEGWTRFAIRSRSPLARAVLRTGGHDAALGRTLALSGAPDAHAVGLDLLDRAVARSGVESLSTDDLVVWTALLLRAGRHDELREALDDPATEGLPTSDRWMLRADLANPHLPLIDGSTWASSAAPDEIEAAEARWLDVFNEAHAPDGLDPVTLRSAEPGDRPYQRLTAPTQDRIDGDLVSVVMSTYTPDRDLLLAARGVLDQTWHNVELLVIDDASGPASNLLLDEVEALDPRVRVVRAPRNGGTYEARNIALTIARGRWMTFQDSDDWTHPRRVEHQVTHLLEHPDVLGNRTWTLRAYPDLTMTFVGYTASRLNASSLLFDRSEVTRLVGAFDSTRKTGDMELPLRLRSVRPGSVRDLAHPRPLAITQLRSGSLSRNDALPGWIRWDRLSYRDSYLEWHQQIARKRTSPILPLPTGRPFPLPRRAWEPRRDDLPEPAPWDVVVLGDMRPKAPSAQRTLGIARTVAHSGLRTAVAHGETPNPLIPKRMDLLPALATDVRLGRVGITSPDEDDATDLLIVTQPEILLHLDEASLPVRTVLVIADDASAKGWSVPAVDAACRRLFGSTPFWGGPANVHAGPSQVRSAVPADRWRDADLAPVVGSGWFPVGSPRSRRTVATALRSTGRHLLLGHHLDDLPEHWPIRADVLRAALPAAITAQDGAPPVPVELHVLQGLKTPTGVLGLKLPPAAWLSFRGTGMTEREFLSHIDVWTYFGEWNETAERGALTALAAGRPCLLGEEAAVSNLTGHLRCVAPEDAEEALVDLLADDHPPVHTSARRESEWISTLTDLRGPRPLSEGANASVTTTAANPH